MDNVQKSAYTEGLEAFTNGMSVKQIPYSKLSENGISWMRGWYTARFGMMLSGKNL